MGGTDFAFGDFCLVFVFDFQLPDFQIPRSPSLSWNANLEGGVPSVASGPAAAEAPSATPKKAPPVRPSPKASQKVALAVVGIPISPHQVDRWIAARAPNRVNSSQWATK